MKSSTKRTVQWSFLLKIMLAELCLYSSYMLIKPEGLRTYRTQQELIHTFEKQVEHLAAENDKLVHEKKEWDTYPFLKEQYVREHLQYIRPDDELYYYIS